MSASKSSKRNQNTVVLPRVQRQTPDNTSRNPEASIKQQGKAGLDIPDELSNAV